MTAPLGFSTTNTTGASFVYDNRAAAGASTVGGNANAVLAVPFVSALDFNSATAMTGRVPGGTSFRKASNSGYAASTNANAQMVLLDGMETYASRLSYAKNGAFIVVLSGTTNATVPLTNTQTNTNSFAGDNVFATVNQIVFYNLSSLDGVASADINVIKSNTNGLGFGATGGNNAFAGITVGGGSRVVIESINGLTVNAANCALLFTPTANGTIGVVVSGA